MAVYDVELTDTFSGEANYSWVERATIKAPLDAADSLLVRRAKRALGLSGRHVTESYGDSITVRFPRLCVVLFITYREG